ncbi:MAG: T9SS type A sorting domain-containing protein, partial [Dehalococcoidia bacterium]
GIEELPQSASPLILDLYPNPIKTSLTVRASFPLHSVKLYDILGTLVKIENTIESENTATISFKYLSAGVYFVKAITEKTETISKVVVTK